MSTHRHVTAGIVATLLLGTLLLGACGEQERADTEPGPDQPVSQLNAEAAEVEAAREAARAKAIRLGQLRQQFPTAGLEVPPADLVRQDRSAAPKEHTDTLLTQSVRTGIFPR